MATEEQVGYRDAIKQVRKALERRLHHLQDEMKEAESDDKNKEIHCRVQEVQHILDVIDSLHR